MPELLITRGLPASGKTTFARAWVAEDPASRLRANRDDLRASLFGKDGVLDYAGEQAVTAAQVAIVRTAIAAGRSVVIDDTNLRLKFARAWADLARGLGANFAVRDFLDVPLETCIERDAKRQQEGRRHVGEDVIRSMHMKFLNGRGLPEVTATEVAPAAPVAMYTPDPALPKAWLVDIDGTLALMNGRGPFEWHRVGEDAPNPSVIDLAQRLRSGPKLIVMSGRDDSCRDETEAWLRRHLVGYDGLLMRPGNDSRRDSVVKAELFWEHVAPFYNVMGVIDDRQQVVDMWRAMGLTCAQVAPGDF